MSSLPDFLSQKLSQREKEGLLRKLRTNTDRIDFSSNDYLGLARSQQLFDLIQEKCQSFSVKLNGAAGSRLLSGNFQFMEEVEKKLAQFFKTEAALIFNSGYMANQSVLSAVPQKSDTILYDELSHACIKDGARLSLASRHPFRHNDLNDLENKIRKSTEGRVYIAVESIYSMDGDECPLPELIQLSEKYGASIILDEAHSTGVKGTHGNGLACSLGLENKIDIRIHTFGKALGVHGACVAGTKELIDYLINFARPFIYTTALPPHSIVSIDCALDFLRDHPEQVAALNDNINLFLQSITFSNRIKSQSAIQTAIFSGNESVKSAAATLQARGLDVRAILSPTVQKNSERLRICLHSYNTKNDILTLSEELNRLTS
jgi:8-amino-7-oxononanoate synthase